MYRVFLIGTRLVILSALTWLTGVVAAAEAGSLLNNPLANSRWNLVEFQSMDDSVGIVRPEDPAWYRMLLNDDGTVELRLNCNAASGIWTIEPAKDGSSGRFEFGPLATTQEICPSRGMDEKIATDAPYIRGYLLRDGKLYLSLMADAGIYVWQRQSRAARLKAPPTSPEQGGPRNWRVADISGNLNLRERPSTSARIVATYAPGTILDNLGCEFSANRSWCYVQQFGGGPVGYVAADFLEPAVAPNGRVMTGPDDSALRAGQKIFDATGTIPCAQYRGQPMTQCDFGVARAGGGYATVVVERPAAARRAIFFRMGKPTGADTSQADGYPEFSASKEADLNMIRIGNERYEIPDAVIFGD